jgi:hypothetical protein
MKIGLKSRNLSAGEQTLALSVFGPTLPVWKTILICDGLGKGDRPYTLDGGPGGIITINMGPIAYPACISTAPISKFGQPINQVFIHEMVHVWQYGIGSFVKASSIWAQAAEVLGGSSAYGYTLGDAWDDYNVEQQGDIVSDWFGKGMSTSDAAFPYIDKVVRRKGANKKVKLSALAAIP